MRPDDRFRCSARSLKSQYTRTSRGFWIYRGFGVEGSGFRVQGSGLFTYSVFGKGASAGRLKLRVVLKNSAGAATP